MYTSCSRSTLRRGNWHVSQAELVQQEWRADRVVPGLRATLHDLADADPLPPCPHGLGGNPCWPRPWPANPDRFLTDLMAQNLALAGRCAAQPEVALGCSAGQGALGPGGTDPGPRCRSAARIAAGLALGELGDPRFVRRQGPDGAYLLPLVAIPGGTYHIGSNEGSMRTKRRSTASNFRLLPWRNSR